MEYRRLVKRVLIVALGHLKYQWQQEMMEKFGEPFAIVDRGRMESTWDENIWEERDQLITSIDFIMQDEMRNTLCNSHWDLVIVDEAYKAYCKEEGMNMPSINLTVGAGQIDRILPNADELLQQYRSDTRCYYLDHQPLTHSDQVVPEGLAVTLLINSQADWRVFHSLMVHGKIIDFAQLPKKPPEKTSPEERGQIAALITLVAQLPGFAASVATKVLHKKRPDLIPILDNQAIFGAYMNLDWPQKPATSNSIKDEKWILKALDWIAFDINRQENENAWDGLNAIEPTLSRIQLFDSIWWMYFRLTQPVLRK